MTWRDGVWPMASSMCSRLVKHYHYYHYHRTTNSGYYGPLHPRLGGQPSSHEGSPFNSFSFRLLFYLSTITAYLGTACPELNILIGHHTNYKQISIETKLNSFHFIADSVQTEYCTTFTLSVRVSVCHRSDISHFSHI